MILLLLDFLHCILKLRVHLFQFGLQNELSLFMFQPEHCVVLLKLFVNVNEVFWILALLKKANVQVHHFELFPLLSNNFLLFLKFHFKIRNLQLFFVKHKFLLSDCRYIGRWICNILDLLAHLKGMPVFLRFTDLRNQTIVQLVRRFVPKGKWALETGCLYCDGQILLHQQALGSSHFSIQTRIIFSLLEESADDFVMLLGAQLGHWGTLILHKSDRLIENVRFHISNQRSVGALNLTNFLYKHHFHFITEHTRLETHCADS